VTDGDRLLRTILADPADDAPRLVLADWLDERDDPRGEFIRVQCRLAGLGECQEDFSLGLSCCCRFCTAGGLALRRRERELLNLPLQPQSAAFAWSMPLHRTGVLLGRPWPDVITFRRGFVDAVTLPTAAFLEHAAALFRAAPVTRVTLADRRPYRERGLYWWVRGDDLTLPGSLPDAIFGRLATVNGPADREWASTSPELAALCASDAAVGHGRDLAGLPGLAPAGRVP
jgi:uncharacterized protein (TIGR02996 family)